MKKKKVQPGSRIKFEFAGTVREGTVSHEYQIYVKNGFSDRWLVSDGINVFPVQNSQIIEVL